MPDRGPDCGIRRCVPWDEKADGPVRRTETPSGHVLLILSFGPEMRVSSPSSPEPTTVTSFVVGMYDEPAVTEHDGIGRGVQVDLTTEGAFALLGLPMDELANRTVAAGDIDRLDVDRLVDRVLDVPQWPERAAVLFEELGRIMASGPRLSPEVAWVDRRLRADPAGARIGALTEEIGWSRDRLIDRFRREVGMPPKAMARVLRYRNAVAELSAEPIRPLAQVAHSAGYADQAHFAREFREFGAQTPTEFLAAVNW